MKKYKILLIAFLFSGLYISAQNKLTIQQAIDIAIKNNYNINIARTGTKILGLSNSYGNAGFFPSVTFLAGTSLSSYNTKQEFSSGSSVNRKNALSNNFNAGIFADWTVFDGMRMFAVKDKLEALEAQGNVSLKIEIENTVSKIILLYYDAVRQQQLIKAADEAMKIYDERMKIARLKMEIGSGSKMDVLQATLDQNAQKSALMKFKIAYETALVSLNQLLTKNPDETYSVEDSIEVNPNLLFSNVRTTAMKSNNQIEFARHDIAIAGFQLNEAKSTILPQVAVNLGYNLNQTKNQVGLVLLNQNKGLNVGVSASMNIFNGYKSRTQIKIAEYNIEQNKFQLSQTTTAVDAAVVNSWKTYRNTLEILKLEQENISIARENVTVALERFRVGSSNTIELMVAQKSFEDAISRLVLARYDAKLAETELLRLQGQL